MVNVYNEKRRKKKPARRKKCFKVVLKEVINIFFSIRSHGINSIKHHRDVFQ